MYVRNIIMMGVFKTISRNWPARVIFLEEPIMSYIS